MIGFEDVVLRLLTAALLGSVIGINRGRLEWAAGLRTHMLVSVGSALAIIVSAYGFERALTFPHVILDPSRVAAQVISGIGFLGAGTILFLEREQVVRGLTTAAGLWATASVGLAAGSGLYVPAIAATVILWSILALLKPVEKRFIRPRGRHTSIVLELNTTAALAAVEGALSEQHAPVRQMRLRRAANGEEVVEVRFAKDIDTHRLAALADSCRSIEGVTAVHINLPTGSGE